MLGFPLWMGWENGCSEVKKDNLERKQERAQSPQSRLVQFLRPSSLPGHSRCFPAGEGSGCYSRVEVSGDGAFVLLLLFFAFFFFCMKRFCK